MPTKNRKIAIVHDWLTGQRGGEAVLEQLCHLYPQADIFTLFHIKGSVSPVIESHQIFPSFLNALPKVHRYYRQLLPLFPLAIERFDLSGYDIIISSSHCVAKGVIPPPEAPHYCYCYTPMRYAWDMQSEYFGKSRFFLSAILHYLRLWDVSSSHRVQTFISISQWIQKRIQCFYNRESTVLYPPVDVHKFRNDGSAREDFYLVASAFAPYKRIDLAIAACEKLERRLVVIGEGQDKTKLLRHAGKHTTFLGRVSDKDLINYYSRAKALIFPGKEDFGIMPLEANACGCPVIAFGKGGARETLNANISGLFFSEQNVDSVCEAILQFEARPWNETDVRNNALHFSPEHFRRGFTQIIEGHQASTTSRTVSTSTVKPAPRIH